MKIVIEVVTPAVVKQLEAENEKLRQEVKRLSDLHEGLHRTVYLLIDKFADFRREMGKS